MHRDSDGFWRVVAALMFTDFVASLEASMIFGALPAMSRIYGGFADVGWVVTGFVLVQASAAAIGGKLGDMYGRRTVLLSVLAISAVGSGISAVGSSLGLILVGRCIQGASGAILPLSFGIIRENSGDRNPSLGMGMVVGAYSISGAVGFVVGGYLADLGAWRGIFQLMVFLPLIAVAIDWRVLSAGTRGANEGRIDFIGAILLAPAVALVLAGVARLGRSDLWVSTALISAGVSLALFWTWWELRAVDPLIDLRRMRVPQMALGTVAFFLLGCGALQMAMLFLALNQQPVWTGIGLGLSGAVAGLVQLPANFLGVVSGPMGGWIAQKRSPRTAALFGMSLLVLCWSALLFENGSVPMVIGCAILSSMGVTIVMVAVPAVIMQVTPSSQTSEATGFAYLVRSLGMGVGAQMMAFLLGSSTVSRVSDPAAYPSRTAFLLAIGTVAGFSLTGLLVAALLPRDRAQRQPATRS